jgi:predicted amino acid dehydrogenase
MRRIDSRIDAAIRTLARAASALGVTCSRNTDFGGATGDIALAAMRRITLQIDAQIATHREPDATQLDPRQAAATTVTVVGVFSLSACRNG